MAKIIETREFTIAQNFACLIEYGNEGGYTDEEEAQLDAFTKTSLELPEGAAHWTFEYGEEVEFRRCEICRLMADCITLKAHAFGA